MLEVLLTSLGSQSRFDLIVAILTVFTSVLIQVHRFVSVSANAKPTAKTSYAI